LRESGAGQHDERVDQLFPQIGQLAPGRAQLSQARRGRTIRLDSGHDEAPGNGQFPTRYGRRNRFS
jgi:hypothetical protein